MIIRCDLALFTVYIDRNRVAGLFVLMHHSQSLFEGTLISGEHTIVFAWEAVERTRGDMMARVLTAT